MQSLASAARLLGKCTSADDAAPLLRELGFIAPLVPLGEEARRTLTLSADTREARISRGDGALRALAFEVDEGSDARSALTQAAARLASRAPDMLWLLVAVDTHRNEVGLATFDAGRSRPRVAAMIAKRGDIVDSDAETACALAAAVNGSDVHTHLRWLDILGRESVSRRFFRELERLVRKLAESLEPKVAAPDAGELALLYVSRLLFLTFLETKGWLDRDHGFLGNRYADCMVAGGAYHRRVLAPLFFGTLNTHPRNRARRARDFGRIPFLNGGLFARAPLEKRTARSFFSDAALGDLFADLLTRFRFTAREDTTSWSEAAIDPEMLGKAFESLMSAADRKRSGAFYTPQSLVRDVARSALAWGLASPRMSHGQVVATLSGNMPRPSERAALAQQVESLRVLDPACGSGAFLVHVLEELSALRVRLGDVRPLHVIRRGILTRSVFGVDINPTAVWLCELRLWLSMAIEDPEPDPFRVTPLPNLDRNIRVGDSLAGDAFPCRMPKPPGGRISVIRGRYSRATGPRKRSLAKSLDRIERECAIAACESRLAALRHERKDIIGASRSRDLFGERRAPSPDVAARLASIRAQIRSTTRESRGLADGAALPFSFSTRFADVAAEGGFHVIVGNPPWVRTHNLDPRRRESLKDSYVVYRNSAWLGGSEAAAAGRGFGSQVDLAALFIERCTDLLRAPGTCALIVPAKLWRSLAGGGVRALLGDRMDIREIRDLTNAPQLFDAAVYPSIIVASRRDSGLGDSPTASTQVAAAAHHAGRLVQWSAPSAGMSFDESRGSPWLLVPADVRAAFDAVRAAGTPMSQSCIGRPMLGVKTGCNHAFLVSLTDGATACPGESIVESGSARGLLESHMLRPCIRGDRVTKWSVAPHLDRLIWTHDETGRPMRTLPSHAMRWLVPWRSELERRSDARGLSRWWSLFRTESADCTRPRVVWSDIGKAPRAAMIAAGDPSAPLNSCYVSRCADVQDALALTALLNSPLAAAWLSVVAEPARGGYKRYLGWTMSILPMPREWERALTLLAPLSERAMNGDEPEAEELLEATVASYRLERHDVEALLQWSL